LSLRGLALMRVDHRVLMRASAGVGGGFGVYFLFPKTGKLRGAKVCAGSIYSSGDFHV
jgi:hypothetical protein